MLTTRKRRRWGWMLAFAGIYGLVGVAVENSDYQLVMTVVLVWAVMGLAWNLLSGYSGLISFGHAAFFGLGAYFVVLAQIEWSWSPWLGIPVAGVLGGLAGLLVGVPTFRLRGPYFALAMLAYPLALLYVFEWLGFQEVAVPMMRTAPAAYMQFADGRVYVFIALALALGAMALTRILEQSRYGMCLLAIKQDETAAEAAGIDTLAWKLRAIVLSGALASAIGGFYGVVQLVVTPASVFGLLVSAQALVVAMFGGVGTVWGPLIGALTLVPLGAFLDARLAGALPGIQGVVYGIAIIAVVLLAPEGVFWKTDDLLRRRAERRRLARAGLSDSTGDPAEDEDRAHESLASEVQDANATDWQSAFAVPAAGAQTILEARGLVKAFGGLKAVDDIGLDVQRGEILGIIGPNGAGKTTLFNLLNGLVAPDAGTIRFDSAPLTGLAPCRICARGIGRTFQVVKPFRRMSIADNVVVGAFVQTRADAAAVATAHAALAAVGLLADAHVVAGNASNRQLRLMELARALASKPKLLLLDEIFAGLASGEVDELMTVIRRLARLGITIVIIEHTMRAMVTLVDRFVVLDHGAVLAVGPPHKVTQDPLVIEAYLGKRRRTDA